MSKELQRLPVFKEPSNLKEAAFSINQLGKNMTEHAYLIGEILIWVKSQLKHGKFMDWVDKNVWFKRSTAQNFLTFAKKCNDAGMMIDTPHYVERPKLPNFGNMEFNLIDTADQQIQKASNGKARICEDRVGLELDDFITYGEWSAVGEILKELPINENQPLGRLEGLTPFLMGDWILFYERKVNQAKQHFKELKEKYPDVSRCLNAIRKRSNSIEEFISGLDAVKKFVDNRIAEAREAR